MTQRTAANGQITKYSYELDYGRLIGGADAETGREGDDIQTWYYWDWNPEAPNYSTGAVGRLAGVAFHRAGKRATTSSTMREAGRRGKRLVIGGDVVEGRAAGVRYRGQAEHDDYTRTGNAYSVSSTTRRGG